MSNELCNVVFCFFQQTARLFSFYSHSFLLFHILKYFLMLCVRFTVVCTASVSVFFYVQAKSLGEHEWRSQQLGVLGGHHFESDTEMSDIDDDDRETLFSSMDLLSPSGHSDAQTLAMMLQEQLDAINKEIRYLELVSGLNLFSRKDQITKYVHLPSLL